MKKFRWYILAVGLLTIAATYGAITSPSITVNGILSAYKLTVNAAKGDYDTVISGTGTTNLLMTDAGNNRIGVGTGTPAATVEVVGGTSLRDGAFDWNTAGTGTFDLTLQSANQSKMLFLDASADFIGIATTTPTAALDVTGNINVTGNVTAASFVGTGSGVDRWTSVSSDDYTSVPASTSQITMSDTTAMTPGMPLRYVYNSVTYYGQVVAESSNAYIRISGAPLSTYTITALHVGMPEQVVILAYHIAGAYADATDTTLLANDANTYDRWQQPDAALVSIRSIHETDDGSSNPSVTLNIGGDTTVNTANTNTGPIADNAFLAVTTVDVAFDPAVYLVTWGDTLDIAVTKNGTGDASDLTVWYTFILI